MKNVVQLLWSKPVVRDWTNQDLADFYRVESALVQAGLSVETDRGMTDEGDPWFVFCQAETQDVIVHCARIDGQYVVASAAFDSVLRGHDFRSVVESVLARHPLVMPRQKEGTGNVHFLPSALMVALVATAFFKLSGEAQAHEIELDVGGPVAKPTFDFSALKHLIIDLDKRQIALIVAAMAYVHSDMGAGTFVEPAAAKAEPAADNGQATEVAHTDAVDHLFQEFMAQASAAEGPARTDHPVTILASAEQQEVVSWSLASALEALQREARPTSEHVETSGNAAVTHNAEAISAISATIVNAKIELSMALEAIVTLLPQREAPSSLSGSAQSAAPAETFHAQAGGEALKIIQSLITEFTVGSARFVLTESAKDQVVATLTVAVETKTVAPSVVSTIEAKPEPTVSSDSILSKFVLEDINKYYDSKNMKHFFWAANESTSLMTKDFVQSASDFAIIKDGINIVFYDPTPTGHDVEEIVTFIFKDSSTLSLVGHIDTAQYNS